MNTKRGFAPISIVVILGAIAVVVLLGIGFVAWSSGAFEDIDYPFPCKTDIECSIWATITNKRPDIMIANYSYACADIDYSCYLDISGPSQKEKDITDKAFNPNDAKRKNDLQTFRQVLEQYKLDGNNGYPVSLEILLSENYLKEIPKDPVTGELYLYEVSENRLDYTITATLEDGNLYQMGPP